MIKMAVLGYGTVGSGVVAAIRMNGELINRRIGDELKIAYVLDRRDFPGDPVQEVVTHDFEEIITDEEVKIVVEVMGGTGAAYTFVKRALTAGKHVATSNKALVAKHGSELLAIAKAHNVNFLFEASVGGGIPILRPLHTSLTADEIEEISGILNGTTNYMLSKMYYEGAEYEDVLKDAQEKGYAERNPEADVEGYDACRKIAILASIITGKEVNFEEIYTEGISHLTARDLRYAKAMGRTIKLFASAKRAKDGIYAIVAPVLVRPEHPLASVNDVFNAIFVKGNVLGDAMFYGSGAGKLPTASAVVADVIDAAKRLDHSDMPGWTAEKAPLLDKGSMKRRFFARVDRRAGIPKMYADVFGPIELVDAGVEGEFGFITEVMSESEYEEKASRVDGIVQMIRVED